MKLLGMIALMFIVAVSVDITNRHLRELSVGHHIENCDRFGGIPLMTIRTSMVCVSIDALLDLNTGNKFSR